VAIIIAAIIFVIYMIAVCCCCWSTSLQDRLKATRKEGVAAECHPGVKFVIMGIPFLMLIAGLLFIAIGFNYYNPLFADLQDSFTITRTKIAAYIDPFNVLLATMPAGSGFNFQRIQSGIQDTTDNISGIIGLLHSADIARNILVWIAVICAALSAILSCIYVQFNKGLLFEYICFFFILLFSCTCLLLPYNSVISEFSDDACKEVAYQEGILSLWQITYTNNVDYLNTFTVQNQLDDDGNTGCDYINQLCQQGACCTLMCQQCTPNNITSFLNYTFLDGGFTRNLSSCELSCSDPLLKNISTDALLYLQHTDYWIQMRQLMADAATVLEDPEYKTYLKGLLCDVSTPVGLTYTGSGILLGGIIICLILCIILRGQGNRDTT